MRTFPINGNAAEVEEALLMTAAAVEPAGAGRWKVAPRQGQGMTVIASIEHGWLCFDASLNGRSPSMDAGAAEWALLESNALLPYGVRSARRPGTAALKLRADLPLGLECDLADGISRICADMPAAADRLSASGSSQPEAEPAPADLAVTREEASLSSLCAEAGWDCVARAGGVSVPLDVPGESQTAFVGNGAGVCARVTQLSCENLTEQSRSAIGKLLLAASWLVFMARPIAGVNAESGWHSAGFEVAFHSRPSARELDTGLKALSVACRICGREALALRDPELAEAYLAVRGGF